MQDHVTYDEDKDMSTESNKIDHYTAYPLDNFATIIHIHPDNFDTNDTDIPDCSESDQDSNDVVEYIYSNHLILAHAQELDATETASSPYRGE